MSCPGRDRGCSHIKSMISRSGTTCRTVISLTGYVSGLGPGRGRSHTHYDNNSITVRQVAPDRDTICTRIRRKGGPSVLPSFLFIKSYSSMRGWVIALIHALIPNVSRLGTFVPSRDAFGINAWMGAITHPRIEVHDLMNKKEGRIERPPFLLILL